MITGREYHQRYFWWSLSDYMHTQRLKMNEGLLEILWHQCKNDEYVIWFCRDHLLVYIQSLCSPFCYVQQHKTWQQATLTVFTVYLVIIGAHKRSKTLRILLELVVWTLRVFVLWGIRFLLLCSWHVKTEGWVKLDCTALWLWLIQLRFHHGPTLDLPVISNNQYAASENVFIV